MINQYKEYLYKLKVTRPELLTLGPTKEEEKSLEAHFNYLKDLTTKGVVIMAGRTLNNDESTFGIVVFRATGYDEAKDLMLNDPAVKSRTMTAELFPFKVALLGLNK